MTETANITQKSKISAIWIIPVIALFVGVWMLYQYQTNLGPTIYITMPQAEGIVAGKTEIKVRSVKIWPNRSCAFIRLARQCYCPRSNR